MDTLFDVRFFAVVILAIVISWLVCQLIFGD